MKSLADINTGQSATVQQISGDDSLSVRLMEMGIIDGQEIEVIGRAPMGDPIEIAVCGYRLSLRVVEARRVLVNEPATS